MDLRPASRDNQSPHDHESAQAYAETVPTPNAKSRSIDTSRLNGAFFFVSETEKSSERRLHV